MANSKPALIQLAAQLRETLRALNMSQAALAERLGVDPMTVNRWATGKVAVPRYAMAYLSLLGEVRDFARRVGCSRY